jgi:hypothetical protein
MPATREKARILWDPDANVKPLLQIKKSATPESCAESTKGGGWRRQTAGRRVVRAYTGTHYASLFAALQYPGMPDARLDPLHGTNH